MFDPIMPDRNELQQLALRTIRRVETETAVYASSSEGAYNALFGRDSLISALLLLEVYAKNSDAYPLSVAQKAIRSLYRFQGQTINIESGEEPGKIVHEVREDIAASSSGWLVYPDGTARSYDSIDSTPLFLLAMHRYATLSGDAAFLSEAMPHVHRALEWVLNFSDSNADGFVDYHVNPLRTIKIPFVQSWMDSPHSLFHTDRASVALPVAPVEVQGYTFAAAKMWANHAAVAHTRLGRRLDDFAARLRECFNRAFVSVRDDSVSVCAGIDGTGKRIEAVRSSVGHLLFASFVHENHAPLSILDGQHIPGLVRRLMAPDLFEPNAGIRTLSADSPMFDPRDRYHNGTIWPHDCELIAIGCERLGFHEEAAHIRQAVLRSYRHFGSPIELFTFVDGAYGAYAEPPEIGGHIGCAEQTWSAAALLAIVAAYTVAPDKPTSAEGCMEKNTATQ